MTLLLCVRGRRPPPSRMPRRLARRLDLLEVRAGQLYSAHPLLPLLGPGYAPQEPFGEVGNTSPSMYVCAAHQSPITWLLVVVVFLGGHKAINSLTAITPIRPHFC
jgi:hypothetical protein